MITFSIIQKSQLEGAHRIDAEYYQPQYLQSKQILLSHKLRRIDELCVVTDGNHSKIGEQFVDSGVRYLRGKDLNDIFISNADPIYIPREFYSRMKRSHIYKNDVLVSIVGTVGLVSIVADDYGNLTGSCKVAILHTKKINQWFLSAFLSSRFGQDQIQRLIAGAVQTGIILQDLAAVKVPVVSRESQQSISEIVLQAYKLELESKQHYQQAESLLLEELRLKEGDIHDNLSYVVKLSEVKVAHRFDAEYFQPKYETLIEHLKKHQPRKLGDLVTTKKGFEPGSEVYQDEGKLFIRVSSLSKFGLTDRDQKYLSDDLYKKLMQEYEPKVGELLLTKDATPGIAYAVKKPIEGIIAGGVLRLKLKEDIEVEYIALCLNSIIGQMQVERDAGGSVIAHWKPEEIKNVLVPIVPAATRKKISELMIQSFAGRKKSKELLEEAKRKVEEMIEGR